MNEKQPGWIVVLNGAPRSGKSSIARAIQEQSDDLWINFGVDAYQQTAPTILQPSIGLRPGGERPDVERHLPVLFAAFYESVAVHSRLGLNVIVDIGHHDDYSMPLGILEDSMRRLAGLPVLIVGVRCCLQTILERRNHSQTGREGVYVQRTTDGMVPRPIVAWQTAVHVPGIYDVELDTSTLSPEESAARIGAILKVGPQNPTARERILASHETLGMSAAEETSTSLERH